VQGKEEEPVSFRRARRRLLGRGESFAQFFSIVKGRMKGKIRGRIDLLFWRGIVAEKRGEEAHCGTYAEKMPIGSHPTSIQRAWGKEPKESELSIEKYSGSLYKRRMSGRILGYCGLPAKELMRILG